MTIAEQVKSDAQAALKAGDRRRASALRIIQDALQQELKLGKGDELAALQRERKKRLEAAEAYRDAQKIKGEGDAKASALYADSFGRDPQFAQFYRSLEAYRATFRSRSDVMVMDPSSEFFKAMRGSGASGAPAPAR